MENLVQILREDTQLLEEVEEQGVVQTILRMSKQSKLDSWRRKEREPKELIIFPGTDAGKCPGSKKEEEEARQELTTVIEVRPAQAEVVVHLREEEFCMPEGKGGIGGEEDRAGAELGLSPD